MTREIEGCMFLKFAKGDAYIMGLLARVRTQQQQEKFSKSVEKREKIEKIERKKSNK